MSPPCTPSIPHNSSAQSHGHPRFQKSPLPAALSNLGIPYTETNPLTGNPIPIDLTVPPRPRPIQWSESRPAGPCYP